MDMSFLYTKAATHDKKVLSKVLTVNVEKAVTIWQQWYQDSKRKKKREIKLKEKKIERKW